MASKISASVSSSKPQIILAPPTLISYFKAYLMNNKLEAKVFFLFILRNKALLADS